MFTWLLRTCIFLDPTLPDSSLWALSVEMNNNQYQEGHRSVEGLPLLFPYDPLSSLPRMFVLVLCRTRDRMIVFFR